MAEVDGGMSPLDFMLSVMRDPSATRAERIEMAKAAAPYFHGRAAAGAKSRSEPGGERPPLSRAVERRLVDPAVDEDSILD